jgi:hypothetical protein
MITFRDTETVAISCRVPLDSDPQELFMATSAYSAWKKLLIRPEVYGTTNMKEVAISSSL